MKKELLLHDINNPERLKYCSGLDMLYDTVLIA